MNSAVLIKSCDAFSDCWRPALECINRFWIDRKWPLFTVTNNLWWEGTNCIQTGDNKGWCKNLKYALGQIPAEFVLLFLEDMFVETVDSARVSEALDILSQNPETVAFRVGSGGESYAQVDERIGRILPKSRYKISTSPTWWRVDYLKQILDCGDSAWDFEIAGTALARNMPGDVLKWIEPAIGVQYTAITRGKREAGAVRFLESHGIEWDSSRPIRGV